MFLWHGIKRQSGLIAFCLLALVIGWFAFLPVNRFSLLGHSRLDHILAFSVLVAVPLFLNPRRNWWVIPLTLLYGLGIELLQPYMGRHRELVDLYADATGLLIGSFVGIIAYRLRRYLWK